MSRLSNITISMAQETVEELYKDIERNIQTSQPSFVRLSPHSQSPSTRIGIAFR